MGLGDCDIYHEREKDETVGDPAGLCNARIWTDLGAHNS